MNKNKKLKESKFRDEDKMGIKETFDYLHIIN